VHFVYRDPGAVGDPLPRLPDEFFQLHVYAFPTLCSVEPDAVFAVHSDDERPRETVGTRHGVEESVRDAGLGVRGDGLRETKVVFF